MELNIFRREKSLNQQRKLFKECFPENEGTEVEKEVHYNWKFHSFPSESKSYEYGAFLEKELIGYYAAIPYEYVVNNEVSPVAMVCDVMTGVKARGKGIFTKLGVYSTEKLKEENLAFSIGYPIRPEVIPGHIKAGWEKMYPLPLFIKFLRSNTILEQKGLKFLSPLANLFLTVYNGIWSVFSKSSCYSILVYNNNQIGEIEGLDEFFREWMNEQAIALNKSRKFLEWRLGAPGKKYKILVAKRGEKIIGYSVVTFVIKENVPSVAVLDISCLSEYKKLTGSLFSKIEQLAINNSSEAIMIMASSHISRKYSLITNGFMKSPYKFWLIIKNFGGKFPGSFLKAEKNWHLTWIDSDDL